MCRPTYTVREYIEQLEITCRMKTAMVTFMLFAVNAISTSGAISYSAAENALPVVETVVGGQSATMSKVVAVMDAEDMSSAAFDNLTARYPEAMEMAPVAKLITGGIGEVNVERIVMDCDMSSKVLNVVYRLPGNILMSINKPLDTMDDDFVMFNVYHFRELLVSDTARIGLLAQYVRNVENKIANQA